MRAQFDQCITDPKFDMDDLRDAWFATDPPIFMSYWYAGLYVVIEGWLELGCHDEEIDRLLESPNVDILRRYRNAVCHFQREYFHRKFFEMFSASGTADWVRELNQAFGKYFLEKKPKLDNESTG
jgi:hypothetical protein